MKMDVVVSSYSQGERQRTGTRLILIVGNETAMPRRAQGCG